jgi:hypothetical protein
VRGAKMRELMDNAKEKKDGGNEKKKGKDQQ